MRKFYMAPDGKMEGEPHEDHADIARRILPTLGLEAEDYGDLYTKMFAAGYARVAVDGKEFHIERKAGFSRAQRIAAEDAVLAGKRVVINNRQFVESKAVRGVSMTLAEQLLAGVR
jgi:hypothetical protein